MTIKISSNFSNNIFKTLITSIIILNLTACSAKNPEIKQENPLVTQAKELQTGSDKVGIDHLKAIELLKKASNEGDAEAMYLLAQYYSKSAKYRYLPENNHVFEQLRLKSAYAGNLEAIESILTQSNTENYFGISKISNNELDKLKEIVSEKAEQGDVDAMLTMTEFIAQNSSSRYFNLEQCKWIFKSYSAGNIYHAGHSLQYCQDHNLAKIGAPSHKDIEKKYIKDSLDKINGLKVSSKNGIIAAKQEILLINELVTPFNLEENQLITKEEKTQLKSEINDFYLELGKKGYSDAYLFLAKDFLLTSEQKDFLEPAAKLNNSIALTLLGIDLLYSDDKNEAKLGLSYLEKASTLKNPEAMYELGWWYSDTDSKVKNLNKAMDYFSSSANLGSISAMESLVELNHSDKYKWAILAFENGSLDEKVLVAVNTAYRQGLGGVQKNIDLANNATKILNQKLSNEKKIDEKFGVQ